MGASFSYACSPLFFELAVEIAYPVPEGIAGGFLTFFWNITAGLFLGLLQLRLKSVLWMDYVLAAQGLISLIFMIFVKEEYRRTSLDRTVNATVTVEEEDPDEEGGIFGEMFRSTTSYGSINIWQLRYSRLIRLFTFHTEGKTFHPMLILPLLFGEA